jgi:signal transduction histidine kinase
MRSLDSPFYADWYAAFFRWIFLIGTAVIAGLTDWYTPFTAGLMITSAVWNIIISSMSIANKQFNAKRILSVVLDFIVAAALFIFSGGLAGTLPWFIILLPIITAGIYYERKGVIWTGVLVFLVQATWTIFGSQYGLERFIWLGIALFIDTVFAVIVGWICHKVNLRQRAKQLAVINQKKEVEKAARQHERDQSQKFNSLLENLSTTLDYQEVLNTILDLCVTAMGEPQLQAELMARAVLLHGEGDLLVACSRRLSPHDQKTSLPGVQGALAQVITQGEPVLVDEPAKDPEISRLAGVQLCQIAYCLPLMRGLDSYGVLLVAHPDKGFFTQDRRETLELLSHQAVIAIQNARLFQDLSDEKEHLVQSMEEARKDLARDLHDGPTQAVASLAMRANIARKYMETDLDAAKNEVEQIENLARKTTNEIRHMLFTLRPLALETQGLEAALQTMAEKMRDNYQQNVIIQLDQDALNRLDATRQGVAFYLVEEAVNNARKHAHADTITVRLRAIPKDPDILLLEIADNGVGFNVSAVTNSYEKRGSLGMVNLRERTDLINGLLHIDSEPGKGTRIRIFIPLSDAATDRLQRSR